VPSRFPKHDAVVKWAKGELGVTEEPPGSNSGGRVRYYQGFDWLPGGGYPWCASFVDAAWANAGYPLPFPSAGAWDLGNRARKAGWAVPKPRNLTPGDIVTFKAGAGHVALFISFDSRRQLIRTLDGNVDNSVAYSTRRLAEVRDLIHVPEKAAPVPPKLTKPPVFEVVTSESGGKVIYVSGARAIGRNLARFLKVHPRLVIRRRKK